MAEHSDEFVDEWTSTMRHVRKLATIVTVAVLVGLVLDLVLGVG